MTTDTATLAEFLLLRVAEDERWANAEIRSDHERAAAEAWSMGTSHLVVTNRVGSPARVLAQCAAIRAVVELAGEVTGLDKSLDMDRLIGRRDEATDPYLGDVILRALALPYADHPEFRADWKQ